MKDMRTTAQLLVGEVNNTVIEGEKTGFKIGGLSCHSKQQH